MWAGKLLIHDSHTYTGTNAAQGGNQGEGRDQEDDQAEDGKTT